MNPEPFVTLIMAAGKGKRMLDPELPKVMYRVNGRPMLDHVVEVAREIGSSRTIVIVGHKRETVMRHLETSFGNWIEFAIQKEQLGTGHAVMQTEPVLKEYDGDAIVLSGDVPLLASETLLNLLRIHRETKAAMTVLTAKIDDPSGYGRIIRHRDGSVDRIVEDKDASPEEKKVDEINSGIYCFRTKELFDALRHVTPENSQHEYYLTDVFGYFIRHGMRVSAVLAKDFDEIRGVNTRAQLEEAERIMKQLNPSKR